MTTHERSRPTERPTDAAGRTMAQRRVIDAEPTRVYAAFLDPDELAEWLPPTGFSAEVHGLAAEVGGSFRITFTAETVDFEPREHSFHGTYLELVPGERIVHTDEFELDDPAMAGEMTVTVTFEAVEDGTEVTVRQAGVPEAIPIEDASAGWADSLSKLAALVEEEA